MDITRKVQLLFQLSDADCVQWVGDETHGETGFLSFRRRATLRVGDQQLKVFVKMSDSSRADMGPLTHMSVSACRRECLFYSTLAPILNRSAQQNKLDTVLPHVHRELLEKNGSVLVMEDLCSEGFSPAPSVMSLEQIRIVVRSAAMLQAAFFISRHRLGNHPLAERLVGAQSPLLQYDILSEIPYDKLLPDSLPAFVQKFPSMVDEERRRKINAYVESGIVKKALAAIRRSQEPDNSTGMAHMDLWYNNCMLRGGECRILDWQFPCVGRLGCDLGLLLMSSADNSFAADEFINCVDFFHQTVKEAFETSTGVEFPVPLRQVRDTAVDSLHVVAGWSLMALADDLYSEAAQRNSLRNMADLLQRFDL